MIRFCDANQRDDWSWPSSTSNFPSGPGNASRLGPAPVLALSGLAPTPARIAQKIVNQTSDHEIRCFPVLRLPFSLSPLFAVTHSSTFTMSCPNIYFLHLV